MKFARHLVWSDGHCERPVDISGFDAMDMLLKERGAARSSGNDRVSEIRGVAGDRLNMLVKTTMASQVHVVGDGCVYYPPCQMFFITSGMFVCLDDNLIVCVYLQNNWESCSDWKPLVDSSRFA